jgi:hypothetical protein
MTGTLSEKQYTLSIISRALLLIMRNVSDKFVEKIKTHFMLGNFVENRDVYEIRWKNTAEPGRPQMTICCIRTAS